MICRNAYLRKNDHETCATTHDLGQDRRGVPTEAGEANILCERCGIGIHARIAHLAPRPSAARCIAVDCDFGEYLCMVTTSSTILSTGRTEVA